MDQDYTPDHANSPPSQPPIPAHLTRRTKEHRTAVVTALREWRVHVTLTRYELSSFTDDVILPDEIIEVLASDPSLQTKDDVEQKLQEVDEPWTFPYCHCDEVLEVIRGVDSEHTRLVGRQLGRLESSQPAKTTPLPPDATHHDL